MQRVPESTPHEKTPFISDPTPQETTPLIPSAPTEGSGTVLTIKVPDSVTIKIPDSLGNVSSKIAEKATNVQSFLSAKYVNAKEMTQKSPWIISIVVCICCFGVVWASLFEMIWELISLSPMEAVLKVYQCVFGVIAFFVEVTRYYDPFGINGIIKIWFKFFDTTLGRGMLQLLPGTIAMAGMEKMFEWLPGLGLVIAGVTNIFYGIYAAYSLRTVVSKMKLLEQESLNRSGSFSQVDMMMSKFSAMDVNGTGRLNKEELLQACKELKIDLSESDVNLVLETLDTKKKGYVDVKDFESWWFMSKAGSLFT